MTRSNIMTIIICKGQGYLVLTEHTNELFLSIYGRNWFD